MDVTFFIGQYKPIFKAERVTNRPNAAEWHKGARHYLVTLSTKRDEYVFFYSQGSAIKAGPILTDVLESLASDAEFGGLTYREAVAEMGEVDRNTWEACRECRDRLIDVFGRTGFADLSSIRF